MEYSFERISAAFIVRHVRFMSWECLQLAFDRGWVTVRTVIAVADSKITSELEGSELLVAVELATLDPMKWHKARALLTDLSRLEKEQRNRGAQQQCWKLWLLVGLMWLHENASSFEDPLAFAEELAEDLDRPRDAAAWLRFMPADFTVWDPREHPASENYKRLTAAWKQYLFREAPTYLKNFEFYGAE
jgi:hypothetical protein